MNKFIDYCEFCKKDVEITEVNMMTAPATCESGHIWWKGKKHHYTLSENPKPFNNYVLKDL